ncbi:hypothetical protein FNV43_RR13916 [Rhamnella rubrinervis]|uniref:Uncharacterized protein n=1 Tax=Rhamnella rubrinervis TaxID=2594499 RepID=A0A8K0H1W5_9ROSA|nr:hypothetical protein FNV43_RR13916 [Rhamnella rubrinervis]
MSQRWWCRARQGCASRRVTGSKGRASETTTVLLCAGMRASLVANAGVSVVAASAPSFARLLAHLPPFLYPCHN